MKMVIIIRTDLNMRKGKMVAQGAHAVVMSVSEDYSIGNIIDKELVMKWINSGQKKIVVGIDSLEKLEGIQSKAMDTGISWVKVIDRGDTEFNGVPTITCLALGPDTDENLDPITGDLKLL